MQVGDIVKHNKKGYIGLITDIDKTIGGYDPLFRIHWLNGATGAHWKNEIEVVNASR